jgi:hypothetical protein
MILILESIETIATKKILLKGHSYLLAYQYSLGLIDMAEHSGVISADLAKMLRELAEDRKERKE